MANLDVRLPQENETIGHPIESEPRPVIRVLAVDDEPAASKLISILLRPPAFYCTTAPNGEAALRALRLERFDAVISDLQMPGISGLELLSRVRRSRPNVAFLVTTGVDDVDVGVQAMRNGADDYLVKPLRETVLYTSLERALHKRHLEKQVEDCRLHLEEMVAERTGQLRDALQQIERSYEDTWPAIAKDERQAATRPTCPRL